MNNELKPCPFCGGKVERTAWYDKTDRFDCEKCGATIFWDDKLGDEADELFNKRVLLKFSSPTPIPSLARI
jgi:ribosomal protein S27AE